MSLNEQQKAVLSRGLGLLSWLVVAAMLGFALGACQDGAAEPARSYEVVCVSGGIPVMRLTAQEVFLATNGWHITADGIEYRTNLECIARPSP